MKLLISGTNAICSEKSCFSGNKACQSILNNNNHFKYRIINKLFHQKRIILHKQSDKLKTLLIVQNMFQKATHSHSIHSKMQNKKYNLNRIIPLIKSINSCLRQLNKLAINLILRSMKRKYK